MCLIATIWFFILNRGQLCLSPGCFSQLLELLGPSLSKKLGQLLPYLILVLCTSFCRSTHHLPFQQTRFFLSTSLQLRSRRSGLFLFTWHMLFQESTMLIKPSLLSNFLHAFRGTENGTRNLQHAKQCYASHLHLQPSNDLCFINIL